MRSYRHSPAFRGIGSLTVAAFLCVTGTARAQVVPRVNEAYKLPTPLSLDGAIAIALKQQPSLYIAAAQATQAEGQKIQAQSMYFPTLTPSYQYLNEQVDKSSSVFGRSNLNNNGSTATITLSQTLLDSGQREVTNAKARESVSESEYSKEDTRQQVILSVTQNYYDLLRDLDLVRVDQLQIVRATQNADVISAQVEAGTTAAKDVYQAKADLAAAQVTLAEDQGLVQTATAALKNSMGINTEFSVEPVPLSFGNLPPTPQVPIGETAEECVSQAYAHRADLKQQLALVNIGLLSIKQSQILAGPTLSTRYNLSYVPVNDGGLTGTDSTLMLSLSYPLFDAGNARAGVRVAQGQRDVAVDQLIQLRQNIRKDVEISFVQRSVAAQRSELSQQSIRAAQVNYDAAIEARRLGVGTTLDVTTAQATLTQAQHLYVAATYDFYVADAQLKRAIGMNDSYRSSVSP
jgi:outer membrane protein